jgi:hypothetical protein
MRQLGESGVAANEVQWTRIVSDLGPNARPPGDARVKPKRLFRLRSLAVKPGKSNWSANNANMTNQREKTISWRKFRASARPPAGCSRRMA